MPTVIYGPRDLVYVTPFSGSTTKYGFLTNVDAAAKTALGHTAVTGNYPTGLVIGANAPKPPRAKKTTATGTESSFVDTASITSAKTAGWKVSAGKVRTGASSSKAKTVKITFEGNELAWKMPNYLYTKISADIAALGILDAASTDLDLVFGARYPKLPRVAKIDATTGNRYTTFCDPAALDALPTGWTTVRASQDRF